MFRNGRRILTIGLGLLLVLSAFLAIFVYSTLRRSFPKTSGELRLPGLNETVEIYRDRFGIPHIYAANTHDLFFAQGYVHAQDRFWQMDFWRHTGSGRLAELFGEDQVDTDRFLRTLGWARVAEEELRRLDSTSREILESYAQGVNAYLAERSGSALSLEYAVLQLINPGYRPEPWQPLHSLTWAKVMAWDLGGNMDDEIERALLLKTFSPEQLAELYPPYPEDHPLIVPGYRPERAGFVSQGPDGEHLKALEGLAPALQALRRRAAAAGGLLGRPERGAGSNSWVISGALTDSGKPYLANDTHLAAQMPSIWYQVGLHCAPKGAACPFEVAGFSFAGAPGVIIGHNDRIAWGFTNVGPDVMDLYIEKINPANPDQYEVNGQWVDMRRVSETIQVAGGEPVELTVRYTRHGPLITDTYLPEDFAEAAGVDLPANFGIALRWTALEPNTIFRAIWSFNQAGNWEEFRRGAAEFAVPAQNLVYADVEGNIGYQMPGNVPVRARGDGRLPVPGWTSEYEWLGYIPFEELPYAFNPPEGYLVTANNAVVGSDYPYLISLDWARGYRARRIVDLIASAPGPIDPAYIQQMQADSLNLNAEALVPLLLELPLGEERLEAARRLLQGWDFREEVDSAPAALFEVFWKQLLAATFHDDLQQDSWPSGGDRWYAVVRNLLENPDSPWWDNRTTSSVERRDAVLSQAFAAAVNELEAALGKDPQRWRWGDLHTLTLENQSLGRSGIAPIEALFNRGPFSVPGGSDLVNNTGWDASEEGYAVKSLPSERLIVDLGNLANSLAIHPTGQSGHAYHPHYADMTGRWIAVQYHPMLWEREQVEAQAEGRLVLTP